MVVHVVKCTYYTKQADHFDVQLINQNAEQLYKQFSFKRIWEEKVVHEENDDAKKGDKYLTHCASTSTQC